MKSMTHTAEPVAQHPDDIAVDAFAAAMKAKLAEARARGRGGWQDKTDCPQQRLSDMLHVHVKKGDPRDVANFCMFLHQRGEAILPAEPAQPADSGRAGDAKAMTHLPSDAWIDGLASVLRECDECPAAAQIEELKPIFAALAAQGQPAERVPDVRAMVNRFLGWSLPKDFAPDGGISFNPLPARHMPHCWPVGTNLFTAAQATAMVEYMLAAPQPGEPSAEDSRNG